MKVKVKIGALLEAALCADTTTDKLDGATGNLLFLKAANKDGVEKLYAFGTNQIERTLVKIDATVEEEGELMMNPKLLAQVLQTLPKDEEVELAMKDKDSGQLVCKWGRMRPKFLVSTETAAIGKVIAKLPFKEASQGQIMGSLLQACYRRIGFSILPNVDANAPGMNGMHITSTPQGVECMATDRSIAALLEIDQVNPPQIKTLIPRNSLDSLQRLMVKRTDKPIDLMLYKNGNAEASALYFKFDDVFYGTNLLAANFPNLRPAMNVPAKHYVTLDRAAFAGALARASAFVDSSQTAYVKLTFWKGVLRLTTGSDKRGDYYEDLALSLEDGEVADDPESARPFTHVYIAISYLQAICGASPSSKLRLGVTSEASPFHVLDEEDPTIKAHYLIAPVKGD